MSKLNSFGSDLNIAIIGASGGIGSALTSLLVEDDKVAKIYAFSRSQNIISHSKLSSHSIDLENEQSIEDAVQNIQEPLDMVLVATGFLHDDILAPEKSLRDLNMDAFQKSFAVNIFGPALVAKYFLPHIPRDKKSVFAAVSARVGSISDNHIGGWYAYRAAKAALNMFLKTTSIEIARRYKHAAVIGLHPGTVDTKLSKPFQANVGHDIFTPEQSAQYLLNVIDQIGAEDSGKIFAWDGQSIPY